MRDGFEPKRVSWIEDWKKIPPYSQKPAMCLDCSFKSACSGGCIAANHDLFGDVHVITEPYCRFKQLVVKHFGHLAEKYKNNKMFNQMYNRGRNKGGNKAPVKC